MTAEGRIEGNALDVPVTCRACGRSDTVRFDLSGLETGEAAMGLDGWAALAQSGAAPPINRGKRCSQVIDVGGWLTLYGMLLAGGQARSEQTGQQTDRTVARQMQLQAGECLDEALKFYDADNDLPPKSAFFTKRSRRQFREHPDLFLRQRLVSLRAKLPVSRTDR